MAEEVRSCCDRPMYPDEIHALGPLQPGNPRAIGETARHAHFRSLRHQRHRKLVDSNRNEVSIVNIRSNMLSRFSNGEKG